MMMGISVADVSAYNPINHRFQGICGTRQMDGYTGPIMSLGLLNEKLSPIDRLLSEISDKMFVLGETIEKRFPKYKNIIPTSSARFRFLSKYLQKYYGDKKIALPTSISVFASIVEARKQPIELHKLLSEQFNVSEKQLSTITIVDKLLKLYANTKGQVLAVYEDILGQCPYRIYPKDNVYLVNDPAKRFWMLVQDYQCTSTENMSHLVHDRISRKDLTESFFKRMIKYYIRREKICLPSLASFMEANNKNSVLANKERAMVLKWNLEQARRSIKEAVKGKPYEEQINKIFSNELKKIIL